MEILRPYFLVFVGAGLGGVMRHGVNMVVAWWIGTGFPWSTAFINVSGSIVMGLLIGFLAFRAGAEWTQSARLFVATGVLGGYTTFSTFSLETILLLERNRVGDAVAYAGGSVLFGVLGLWLGLVISRTMG